MNVFSQMVLPSITAFPDQPALQLGTQCYSYTELNTEVSAYRQAIRNNELPQGSPIALLASRSLTAYAGILACVAENHPWVPLNPKFPEARNLEIWHQSQASGLIVGDECRAGYQALCADLGNHHGIEKTGSLASQDNTVECEPNHIAYLLFTSGTTGKPKGIPVSHGNLLAYIQGFLERYPLASGLRFSQLFDLTFDLSVHDLFISLSTGGCLVVPSEFDVLMPLQYARQQQLDVWFSVPTLANQAKHSGLLRPGCLPRLSYSFFCGEALPVNTVQAWQAAAPESKTVNLYGPTEATIAITAYDLQADDPEWQQLSVAPIGSPYPHQHALVVTPDNGIAATNTVGELWLGGSQITAGYLNNPVQTQQAFVHHPFPGIANTYWYKTGDAVMYSKKLGLEYLGRLDRQIKINGFRIELQEVEQQLRIAAQSDLVAVVPWPKNNEGLFTGLVGFVVDPGQDTQAILNSLTATLPSYMVPTQLYSRDDLPTNANGKLDYAVLARWLAGQ